MITSNCARTTNCGPRQDGHDQQINTRRLVSSPLQYLSRLMTFPENFRHWYHSKEDFLDKIDSGERSSLVPDSWLSMQVST